jgi:glucose/arabinose dehydrogenase
MRHSLYAAMTATVLAVAPAAAEVVQSEEHDFRVELVVQGLQHPWGLAFLPDGRVLVTERPGRLRVIQDGQLLPEPVAGLPFVEEIGQGGLLDVALHPEFERNRWIYLSYAGKSGISYGTEVIRARFEGHALTDVQNIFTALPKSLGGRHFGSRLLFLPDGTLLITLGDRGEMERAQDLGDHAGSLIRVRDDGSVPPDNPFVNHEDARPEIYTYGNRNIQGIALQPGTGRIWMHEHGPQGGDEINIVSAGTNYGWPVITYGCEYVICTKIGDGTEKDGMAQPVHYWVPSIAPSGMAFYDADQFPGWRGDLFVGSLKFGFVARLEVEDDQIVREERLLEGGLPRVRDVRQGPDGYLYLLTDETNGKLLRLVPVQ